MYLTYASVLVCTCTCVHVRVCACVGEKGCVYKKG